MQSRNSNLRAEGRLGEADWNFAVQVRSPPLEKRVLLYVEKNVQIACWTAMCARLTLTGHAQARSRVDAGRNGHLNGAFAFDAALSSALRASLTNCFPGATASGARARDRKESLLIGDLAAPAAGPAGSHSGSGFGASAAAGLAIFMARNPDLGVNAGCGLAEGQGHVIPQIRAALRA